MLQLQPPLTVSPPPVMLAPRRAAAALGISEYTLRQWLATGYVKGVPAGQRKVLLNVNAIRQKLEEV